MDEKRYLSLKELLNMRKEIISEEEYEAIKEKYRVAGISASMTKTAHCLITGIASRLAKTVIDNNGSEEEVKKAILNLMICADALKHDLDYKMWKKDNNIAQLFIKYSKVNKKE